MAQALLINEIFHSIQGESTRAGLPCVFVRLAGCHLRCAYCDTEYAFHEGKRMSIDRIISTVETFGCDLVEITGGEPLLQPSVHPLMKQLCDRGRTLLLETSGASDISLCDGRVIRILDLKCPDSGEVDRNLWSNIEHLKATDEIKFVISSRRDYEWARTAVTERGLAGQVRAILMSPVHAVAPGRELPGCETFPLRDLAKWILEDRLPVRLQTQLHKLVWDPTTRGV